MKFVFSPAKEMAFKNPHHQDWSISPQTEKIVEKLSALSDEDYQSLIKVSDKQWQSQAAYRISWQEPVTYPAIHLYHGLAYRQIQDDDIDQSYLDDHMRILSAFYGVLKPFDLIKAYRLDFNMGFKIEGQPLKKFWKGVFDQSFEEGEVILNLASQEFSSLLEASRYHWVDVNFSEEGKSHSTLSKKGRGLLVNYMNQHKVMDLEGVKSFNLEGYRYDERSSSDHSFSFIR